MDEVTAAIAKLTKGRAPGVCRIRAEMLENEERAVGSYHYVLCTYICIQIIIYGNVYYAGSYVL